MGNALRVAAIESRARRKRSRRKHKFRKNRERNLIIRQRIKCTVERRANETDNGEKLPVCLSSSLSARVQQTSSRPPQTTSTNFQKSNWAFRLSRQRRAREWFFYFEKNKITWKYPNDDSSKHFDKITGFVSVQLNTKIPKTFMNCRVHIEARPFRLSKQM